jgi:hypothetical protein
MAKKTRKQRKTAKHHQVRARGTLIRADESFGKPSSVDAKAPQADPAPKPSKQPATGGKKAGKKGKRNPAAEAQEAPESESEPVVAAPASLTDRFLQLPPYVLYGVPALLLLVAGYFYMYPPGVTPASNKVIPTVFINSQPSATAPNTATAPTTASAAVGKTAAPTEDSSTPPPAATPSSTPETTPSAKVPAEPSAAIKKEVPKKEAPKKEAPKKEAPKEPAPKPTTKVVPKPPKPEENPYLIQVVSTET